MRTFATALSRDQLDRWQILFHETMAALLRAEKAVQQRFGFWGLLNSLWKSNRDLKALNASLKSISELPGDVLTADIVQSQILQLRNLLTSIEDLIDTARLHQLTNRSLTGAILESIRIRGESIADYLESLEISIDPNVLKAIHEGHDQIERGEFETMRQLF